MRHFLLLATVLFLGLQSCDRKINDILFQEEIVNAHLVNEGYQRCSNFVYDWLGYADPETGLIPKNLMGSKNIWNPKDAAADNYPFMVLTAAIIDRELFEGKMRDILETERRLTNRIDRLPDTYSFTKKGFADETPDKDTIIFGASEYVKDGLLPLTEYIGITPWSERMIEILDDIWKNADYNTPFGNIPSLNVEVNGDLMQVLSRVFWMTGDEKYLIWAMRLADYYLLGDHHPTRDLKILRLRDHGCEVISGLYEVYVTVAYAQPEKKEIYKKPVYEMLDRILDVGTNEHGLFYNQINPVSGEILDSGIADTWGYTFNAYYSLFLLDNHLPYKEAAIKALNNLFRYKNYNWESKSADGYADAIESALNLFNREPVINTDEWIESQIQIMWSMQDSAHIESRKEYIGKGIIEGWHGDGNFARTTMMFCLWKTQGMTMIPWNEKLFYGAENKNGVIRFVAFSESGWEGKLNFDTKRHKNIFSLPLDYPRINQFPEWFTINENNMYAVANVNNRETKTYSGNELTEGVKIVLKEGEKLYLEIRELK